MADKLSASIQKLVRHRAGFLCEYCHANEIWQHTQFTIDHLIPIIAGGKSILENLALACFHCNRRKSDRQSAIDPSTGEAVLLFNPRLHRWEEHFVWSANGLLVVPLTAIGRATCDLLDFNRERAVRIRQADLKVNRHPPADDPILPTQRFEQ